MRPATHCFYWGIAFSKLLGSSHRLPESVNDCAASARETWFVGEPRATPPHDFEAGEHNTIEIHHLEYVPFGYPVESWPAGIGSKDRGKSGFR